ncbi:MHYT domain-containing protein [Lacibacterium aquatile]|uniref:histidine kinase n=1 Tax=Lacibacterium aquatile TaxID=1168082 RepID=A0ABW5DQ19_9PROT
MGSNISHLMQHSHSMPLVLLSFIVAAFAAFTALDMAERLRRAEGRARLLWLNGSAFVLGGGIWTMHFIGMLAFDTGLPVDYHLSTTIVSFLLAVAFVAFGFALVADSGEKYKLSWPRLLTAGPIVGLGVAAMHYTGMAALRLPGRLHYDTGLVIVSVLIAVVAATAALYLAFTLSKVAQKLAAAVVMAIAVCGMHYTGMAAVDVEHLPEMVTVHGSLKPETLALGVAGIFFVLLIIALGSAFIDRRIEAINEREAMALRAANQKLMNEVAERRAVEAELRTAREELEARVTERTRALAEANNRLVATAEDLERARQAAEEEKEKAEQANQAKSDFLASMSHELRTPLNAILGFTQLLSMSQKEPLTTKQGKHVAQISRAGHHLLSLINDILDLSKIEAGALPVSVEEVEVAALFDQLRTTLQPMSDEYRIAIAFKDAPGLTARADRTRLLQILSNFCSNALKYNRPGGAVTVSTEVKDQRLLFHVTDTGLGIPADRLSELFQPFSRLGQEHSTIEGTGIGLTIAQRLAGLMDGKITVESTIDVGSTFTLTVPLGAGLQSAAPAADAVVQRLSGSRSLLYVEDNPSNLQLMIDLCETLDGIDLATANAPIDGIELARRLKPDLIILDINLPGMSGFEVLQKLQQLPETMDIPVIALSAAALPREVERGLSLGFKRYLTKPLHVPTFLGAIDDILVMKEPV